MACLKSSGIRVLANSSSSSTMKESPSGDHRMSSVFLDSSRKLTLSALEKTNQTAITYLRSFCTNGGIDFLDFFADSIASRASSSSFSSSVDCIQVNSVCCGIPSIIPPPQASFPPLLYAALGTIGLTGLRVS